VDIPDWVFSEEDRHFMALALEQARRVGNSGEVPVGAVLVHHGELIAAAGNAREREKDPTAHAEILVLREAGHSTGDWRLKESVLYVSLEPCPMCLEACRQARLDLIIWGASDPIMGACGTVLDHAEDARFGWRLAQRGGLLAEESRMLLKEFFAKQRISS